MTAALVIAAAEPRDCDALAKLHAASFEDAWNAAAFAALLARPGALAYTARNVGAPDLLGLVLVQVAADECEILSVATAAAARRQKIATSLIGRAAQAARAAGAHAMFLEVAESNEAASALYARLGFAAIGRRRGYYRSRDGSMTDALLLRANLPLPQEPSGV